MRQESVRRYAPLAVAVAVLAVLAVVWGVLRLVDPAGEAPGGAGSGSGEPTPIELSGWAAATSGQADPRYHLAESASLPDGPATVAVHRVVPRDAGPLRAAVRAAAASDASRSLTVEGSGHWSMGLTGCAVAMPGDAAVGTVSSDCPTAVPTPRGARDPRAVVAPVLAAAGLAGGDAQVQSSDGSDTVTVRPAVADLPTSGLTTQLVVSDGKIVSGDGWAVETPAGAAYPVVSARDAYDRLVHTPLPMPLMACPEPKNPDTNPVTCGGPVTVTGARMGLSLQPTRHGWLLVPAWLFDVEGSTGPLVQIAVEPRFVEPADAGGSSGSGGGSTGSSGSATAVPPSAGPGEPVPDPVSRFTSVTRGADDRRLDVTFWGGVKACYSYDVRVVEDDQRVQLYLVEGRPGGDKPCIDLAQERRLTVALRQPLGLRTVEDGDTGRVLLGPRK